MAWHTIDARPDASARVLEIGGIVLRTVLGGKVHRATVTEADLDYEGSITVDRDLLDAAGMLPHELVHVWNVTSGERLTTYLFAGESGSGVVCVNGAAAHHARPGDLVVIATFVQLEDDEARRWQPRVVFVDEQNRPRDLRPERIGGAASQGAPATGWPGSARLAQIAHDSVESPQLEDGGLSCGF